MRTTNQTQAITVLKSYPQSDKVSKHYDNQDFSTALTSLFPGFEYPNFSHLTIAETLQRQKGAS